MDNLNLTVNEHLNIEFTVEEISNSIKRLKMNKVCGTDNIKNEFLKNCNDDMLILITELFNNVLNSGIVPTDWGNGMIIPLFKIKAQTKTLSTIKG